MSNEPHNPSNLDAWDPRSFPSTMHQAGTSKPQDVICNWIRALGVDPNHIPADPRASMADGQLTLRRFVRDPDGGDVLTPDRTAIMTETITVPVTVTPPPIVKTWLAPKCPTCGR
jgi:hypothetical protein